MGQDIGAGKLAFDFAAMVQTTTVSGTYRQLISDVLSLFILIELSRWLVEYFDNKNIQVSAILDAGLVFVLREILIFFYD